MDAETISGLQLIRTDGVGPVTYHGLIAKFGSALAAVRAFPELSGPPSTRGPRVLTA